MSFLFHFLIFPLAPKVLLVGQCDRSLVEVLINNINLIAYPFAFYLFNFFFVLFSRFASLADVHYAFKYCIAIEEHVEHVVFVHNIALQFYSSFLY